MDNGDSYSLNDDSLSVSVLQEVALDDRTGDFSSPPQMKYRVLIDVRSCTPAIYDPEAIRVIRDDAPAVTQRRFQELAHTWRMDTGMLSRLDKKYMHPAYQQIIGMGRTAIPFILRDLKATGGHWFWALCSIVGENPVPRELADDVTGMTEAWLAWGRNRGYNV